MKRSAGALVLAWGMFLATWACSGGPPANGPVSSGEAGPALPAESGDAMKNVELSAIEAIRGRYEAELMATPGVVAVSLGLGADGEPCLKVGTSRPVAEVREKLPAEIFQVPVELEYLGSIEAQ